MGSRSEFDDTGRDIRTHIIEYPRHYWEFTGQEKAKVLHPWGNGIPDLGTYVRAVGFYHVISTHPLIFTRDGGGVWMLIEVSDAQESDQGT
jgi:hypothetical protein